MPVLLIYLSCRYIQTLHCCQINEDLKSLPNADDTNLGNTVIPIGLQQKIEIARALYAYRYKFILFCISHLFTHEHTLYIS